LVQIAASLSKDEQAAANKFHFDRDRRRYIISHSTLRKILSQYLRTSDTKIKFTHDKFGKPALESNAVQINFNMSHSGDMALFAIASRKSVGVDIEYIHPIEDLQGVAKSFLSTAEKKEFLDIPEEMQLEAFFRGWTRKEALSKAIGKGISLPLDQVEVGVNPNQDPMLKIGEVNDLNRTDWQLVDLIPSPGYVGALAVENLEMSIRLFTYSKARGNL
jgi:4'-phosphopantetheinyl transferase